MKSYISLLITAIVMVSLSQAKESVTCLIEIVKVTQHTDTYTLELKHDSKCEIIIEHNRTHIGLLSKVHEAANDHKVSEKKHSAVVNDKVEAIIALAKSKMGDSYAPAKAGPDHFDCSGFVYYVFKQNGITIPRSSLQQSQSASKLKREELKRGDILSFDTYDRKHINHSGIYLGDGKFIHSSSGKAYGVTISNLDKGFYKDKFRWGVRKLKE